MSDNKLQENKVEEAKSSSFTPSTKEHAGTGSTQPSSDRPDSDETVARLPEDLPARTVHGLKWCLICISLYLNCMIYGLDGTVTAAIQAEVVEKFGNIEKLAWLGTGFPLGSVCTILLNAALYAKFDMKIIFIASVVLFEAGSALCGAAPTMDALIIGRVIAGIGGSGMYIGVLNYFSMLTSLKERGFYMGIVGLVWGAGAILGPVVGGGVVAVLCAPIIILYLPSMHASKSRPSILSRLLKIDWTGLTFTTGAIISITMVLTFAGTVWKWDDGRTISMFVISGALLLLAFLQQHFAIFTTREDRMFPPSRLFRSRTQIILNIAMFLSAWAVFIALYYIPNYFQFVHGDSAITAAVRLLPFVIIMITASASIGALLPKLRYYSPVYLMGGIFILVGSCLMYTVTPDSSPSSIYGYSVLLALGAGLTMNTGYAIAGIDMTNKGGSAQDINDVVMMQNISQISGILAALLISGQIFQSLVFQNLKTVIGDEGFTDAQIRSVAAGTGSAIYATLSPELAIKVVGAIAKSISKLYILTIAAGGVMLISSLFMKHESLFKSSPASSDDDIESGVSIKEAPPHKV